MASSSSAVVDLGSTDEDEPAVTAAPSAAVARKRPAVEPEVVDVLSDSEDKQPKKSKAAAAPAAAASSSGSSSTKQPRTRPPLRLVIVADIHNEYGLLHQQDMPPGDVLIICGDWESASKLTTWLSSLEGKYKHVLVIHGNHDAVHRKLSCQQYVGEGAPSSQTRPPLDAGRMESQWHHGADPHPPISKTYEEALKASEWMQRIVSPQSQIHSTHACVLRDSGVVIGGWTFYGSPWHAAGFNPTLFTATEETLNLIYSYTPKTTDVLITHGPCLGACDRASGSIEKDSRKGATGFRDLEDPNDNPKFKKSIPARLGSSALRDQIGLFRPALHAFGHIHARQSKQTPDLRHARSADGRTLHVNAAMMQTLPSVAYKLAADSPLKPLRKPTVVLLSEEGASVVDA